MTLRQNLNSLKRIRKADEILVYITSDKQPGNLFSTKIATDVLPIFDKHLYKIGKKNKIALFLNTDGGLLEAPWPLVSLIREYCKELEVIIPNKALSAGTLISLGADKILMTPVSYLSPIDPQGSYVVGNQRREIQVEDVTGYVNFMKDKVGLTEQNALAEAMKALSAEVPPSIIGSINRAHFLIRNLATNLLKSHKTSLEETQVKLIVENLTEKLYSHKHMISRREAKKVIGFKSMIDYATIEEETLIRDIFSYFSEEMQLNVLFNPLLLLGDDEAKEFSLKRGIIKSSVGEDAFLSDYVIQRQPQNPQPFAINLNERGWEEINE